MRRHFHNLDLFRKVPQSVVDDYVSANVSKKYNLRQAIFKMVKDGLLVGFALFIFWSWYSVVERQEFVLDIDPTKALDKNRLRVVLNVTIHDVPCIDLSLDYQDVMGAREVDVRSTVFKTRLKKDGSPVEILANDPQIARENKLPRNPHSGSKDSKNTTCGSCYGALPSPPECCNTCADVMYAYRLKRWGMPRIESIVQCQGEAGRNFQPPQIMQFREYVPRNDRDIVQGVTKQHSDVTSDYSKDGAYPPLKVRWSGGAPLSALKHWAPAENLEDKAWPDCVHRNTVVHGFVVGTSLLLDLTAHGATAGCSQNDCTRTDKFVLNSMDECARVCSKIADCKWWSHGNEDGALKCWLRSTRSYRDRAFQFTSGAQTCVPSSDEPAEKKADAPLGQSDNKTIAHAGEAKEKVLAPAAKAEQKVVSHSGEAEDKVVASTEKAEEKVVAPSGEADEKHIAPTGEAREHGIAPTAKVAQKLAEHTSEAEEKAVAPTDQAEQKLFAYSGEAEDKIAPTADAEQMVDPPGAEAGEKVVSRTAKAEQKVVVPAGGAEEKFIEPSGKDKEKIVTLTDKAAEKIVVPSDAARDESPGDEKGLFGDEEELPTRIPESPKRRNGAIAKDDGPADKEKGTTALDKENDGTKDSDVITVPRRALYEGEALRFSSALSSLSMPFVSLFDQKHRDLEAKRKEQEGESCQMHGYFDANKVPGDFHIGAHGHMTPSLLGSVALTRRTMQHTVHSLFFTEPHADVGGAQRGLARRARGDSLNNFTSPEAFTFQYYVTLTPATYVSLSGDRVEDYVYTSGSFVTNELVGPAVYFKLEIDPIRVIYTQERAGLSTLILHLLAAIGGAASLLRVATQLIET